MPATNDVKHVLRFPEGRFLIIGDVVPELYASNREETFFLPDGHDTAYSAFGERGVLHGKIAQGLTSTNPAVKKYALTYEFEDGVLLSARLIAGDKRSKGVLADARETADLAQRVADGRIELRVPHKPPTIYAACKMADGRTLLNVYDDKQGYSLLAGQPGAYEKLEISFGVQGGSSHRFTLEDGTLVHLNWQDRGRTLWAFGDQPMQPMPLTYSPKDLVSYGLPQAAVSPHLDPFSPELQKAAPAPRAPAPKGP